jgi:hypothetical protein
MAIFHDWTEAETAAAADYIKSQAEFWDELQRLERAEERLSLDEGGAGMRMFRLLGGLHSEAFLGDVAKLMLAVRFRLRAELGIPSSPPTKECLSSDGTLAGEGGWFSQRLAASVERARRGGVKPLRKRSAQPRNEAPGDVPVSDEAAAETEFDIDFDDPPSGGIRFLQRLAAKTKRRD